MLVQEPTLLTGPYDWEPDVLPQSEFEGRLERVRVPLAASGAAALAVFGHPRDYGALAYLTNLTPKNGAALALVPRAGPLRMLVAGTPRMMPTAKLLTWVDDVRPMASVPKLVAEFVGEGGTLATWGFGALPQGIYGGIAGAIAPRRMLPLDAELDAVRRRKSPRELELIRAAARLLVTAAGAFSASVRAGSGVRSAAIAAERAATAAGAQDARTMASLAPGGTPLPLDAASDDRVLDPVNAAFAVQHHGYWASGSLTLARAPLDALTRARDGLAAALKGARAGAHLPAGTEANAIGLSLEEGAGNLLEAGAVYAVSVRAKGEGSQSAIASALIAMTDGGYELLWRSDQ